MPEQPDLFGTWNSDAINADEINGGGVNWPLSPVLFDTFEPKQPLIMTDALQALFTDQPDYIVPAQMDLFTVPGEIETLFIR
jgi:hypothetical protein